MNRVSANDPVIKGIPINNFLAYLERMGWTKVTHPNRRIHFFQGPLDDQGEALQLIIPRDHDLEDANLRLAEALNLVMAVHVVPLDYVIDSMRASREDLNRVANVIAAWNPKSRWLRLSTNPVLSLVLGVFLTGVVGTYLVSYHSTKQRQLELTRIRVNRMAEVWTKVFAYEAAVVGTLQEIKQINVESGSRLDGQGVMTSSRELKKAYDQTNNFHTELLGSLNDNRFWLGDDAYSGLRDYVDGTLDYYFLVKSGDITREIVEKRDQARVDLDRVRERILKG